MFEVPLSLINAFAKISEIYWLLFLQSSMLFPESRWQLMKQKDVSSNRKRIKVAPLLSNFAEKPNFILDEAMSVIC
jgi:hypothetical protein